MEWFEILGGILDNHKIRIIRKGPGGDTLVILWLVMLAEAGRCDRGGRLMISESLPYNAKGLSHVTDIPLGLVRMALEVFIAVGLIERSEGVIIIRNWDSYQCTARLEKRTQADGERR